MNTHGDRNNLHSSDYSVVRGQDTFLILWPDTFLLMYVHFHAVSFFIRHIDPFSTAVSMGHEENHFESEPKLSEVGPHIL